MFHHAQPTYSSSSANALQNRDPDWQDTQGRRKLPSCLLPSASTSTVSTSWCRHVGRTHALCSEASVISCHVQVWACFSTVAEGCGAGTLARYAEKCVQAVTWKLLQVVGLGPLSGCDLGTRLKPAQAMLQNHYQTVEDILFKLPRHLGVRPSWTPVWGDFRETKKISGLQAHA